MVQQAKKRQVSNPLGLAILSLLFERPMHPYEMAATLRQRAKEASIKLNYGSLYTTVKALERAGYIVAQQTIRESARPERTIYGLTPPGRVELVDWMRELLGTPVKEYSQFEAALSLMPVLAPAEVAGLLRQRLEQLENELEQLRTDFDVASKHGVERLFLIETEYLVAMLAAERAWVAQLVRLIEKSPEFTRTWRAFHRRKHPAPGAATKAPEGPKPRRDRRRH